jgi:hypothetical protein
MSARESVPASVVRGVIDAWKQDVAKRRTVTAVDPIADAFEHCAAEMESEIARAINANRLLTVEQFARLRDVDGSTVRRWCLRGELPGEKNEAGDWMIPAHATRARSA